MSKVKANNFEIAKKELANFSEDLIGQIPSEISENDSKHYVCAMVKVIDRPGLPKNLVKVDIIHYDKVRFERVQKQFQFLGYSKLILVHDPSQESTTVQTTDVDDVVKQIKRMKVEELDAYAQANEIVLEDGANKNQKIETILNWYQDNK